MFPLLCVFQQASQLVRLPDQPEHTTVHILVDNQSAVSLALAHFVFQCTALLLLGNAQKSPRLTSRSKWVGETDWAMSSRRPFQVSVFVSSVLSKRKSVSAPHSVRDTQRHVCLPEQLIVPPCPSPQLLCFRLPPPAAAAESGRPLQGRELESVASVAIETPFHLLLLVISLHTTIDLPPHTHAHTICRLD